MRDSRYIELKLIYNNIKMKLRILCIMIMGVFSSLSNEKITHKVKIGITIDG